jgi:hypothetical protein
MRKARLNTWSGDRTLRGLQLHQIERNFPFLLKVAYEIDKTMRERGHTRLLLCSRDCFLLFQLMGAMGLPYQCEYFFSSRVARYRPSEEYSAYAKSKIDDKTLIVDMCGTGNSLKYFCDKFGGHPLLVVSGQNNVESLVRGGLRETSNPALHDSFVDLPIFNLNYDHRPETRAMVDAFLACVTTNPPTPNYTLEWALKRMEDTRTQCLWADHLEDSKRTYELLKSGWLPHEVTL